MTASESLLVPRGVPAQLPSATLKGKPRWSVPHYLAIIGVPVLAWNAWTVIAWLVDGPTAVRGFSDEGSVSWYAAKAIEIGVVLASLAVVVYLVRNCRRAGQILTLEVMYCMVGATIFWSDYGMNTVQPIFQASSNFINVNNTCGHMPFVINPDCGRGPEPIVFFLLFETFLCLPLAIGVSKVVTRVRGRWPTLSTAQLFGLVMGIGILLSLSEIIMLALGIWTYAGPQWMSFSPGHGTQYHPVVLLQTGMFSGLMCAIYIFRNDKGQTIAERGLERHSPRRRKVITLMALYTCVQFTTWIPANVPLITMSFYQDGWPKLPAHLLNDVCDSTGAGETRYGPCPGSPGYRLPGRHSLPIGPADSP